MRPWAHLAALMMRSVGRLIGPLKTIDQGDGGRQVDRATWEQGVEQQAGLGNGEDGVQAAGA